MKYFYLWIKFKNNLFINIKINYNILMYKFDFIFNEGLKIINTIIFILIW